MPGVGKSVALTYKERIQCAKNVIKVLAEGYEDDVKRYSKTGMEDAALDSAKVARAYRQALSIIEGEEDRP